MIRIPLERFCVYLKKPLFLGVIILVLFEINTFKYKKIVAISLKRKYNIS